MTQFLHRLDASGTVGGPGPRAVALAAFGFTALPLPRATELPVTPSPALALDTERIESVIRWRDISRHLSFGRRR